MTDEGMTPPDADELAASTLAEGAVVYSRMLSKSEVAEIYDKIAPLNAGVELRERIERLRASVELHERIVRLFADAEQLAVDLRAARDRAPAGEKHTYRYPLRDIERAAAIIRKAGK